MNEWVDCGGGNRGLGGRGRQDTKYSCRPSLCWVLASVLVALTRWSRSRVGALEGVALSPPLSVSLSLVLLLLQVYTTRSTVGSARWEEEGERERERAREATLGGATLCATLGHNNLSTEERKKVFSFQSSSLFVVLLSSRVEWRTNDLRSDSLLRSVVIPSLFYSGLLQILQRRKKSDTNLYALNIPLLSRILTCIVTCRFSSKKVSA